MEDIAEQVQTQAWQMEVIAKDLQVLREQLSKLQEQMAEYHACQDHLAPRHIFLGANTALSTPCQQPNLRLQHSPTPHQHPVKDKLQEQEVEYHSCQDHVNPRHRFVGENIVPSAPSQHPNPWHQHQSTPWQHPGNAPSTPCQHPIDTPLSKLCPKPAIGSVTTEAGSLHGFKQDSLPALTTEQELQLEESAMTKVVFSERKAISQNMHTLYSIMGMFEPCRSEEQGPLDHRKKIQAEATSRNASSETQVVIKHEGAASSDGVDIAVDTPRLSSIMGMLETWTLEEQGTFVERQSLPTETIGSKASSQPQVARKYEGGPSSENVDDKVDPQASKTEKNDSSASSHFQDAKSTAWTRNDEIHKADYNAVAPMEDAPTATTANISDVHQPMLEYCWNKSIWDVSIFIGTDQMSIGSSVATSVCLICYIILAMLLVRESGEAMLESTFDPDSRHEFTYWRHTVAHDVELRNKATGESLAGIVCNQKTYTPYATMQLEAVQLLSEYLDWRTYFGFNIRYGVFMCSLVLCVWFARLAQELIIILDFLSAFTSLPFSSCTTFKQDANDPCKVELVSTSRFRYVFILLQFIVRLVVVCCVGWYGSRFLIRETSLTDMLMNGVAMDFVLNLDELCFSSMLPKIPRTTLERVQPLSIQYEKVARLWHTLGHLVAAICVVVALALTMKVSLLDPFVVELELNLDALCGGVDDSSFDFVMSVDSIGIPWFAKTPSLNIIPETYAQHAISEVKEFGFPATADSLAVGQRSNNGSLMQVYSAFELERYIVTHSEFLLPHMWTVINLEDIGEVVGWDELNALHQNDFGDQPGTVYNQYLQYLLGIPGQVSCAAVPAHRCHEHGSEAMNVVMRKLCPNWCGCVSPTTGTVSSAFARDAKFGFLGCPVWSTQTQFFNHILEELPCEDTTTRDPFITWLQGVGDARHQDGLLADHLLASFEIGGCAELVHVEIGIGSITRICSETSLPAICPVSCGCDQHVSWNNAHTTIHDYCPHSCDRDRQRCITVAINHTVDTGSYGPVVGFSCIFPFEYQGKTYNSCTTHDWSGPWCAVTLKEKRVIWQWGDCPPGC